MNNNSAMGRSYNKFRNLSTGLKLGLVTTMVVVLVLLVRYLLKKNSILVSSRKYSPMIVGNPVNAFEWGALGKKVPADKLEESYDGIAFTYSMWIYVSSWDWKFNEYKFILNKGIVPHSNHFELKLYPKTNALSARIKTTANDVSHEGCDIQDFPLQKWTHLVYVLNNRTVNIYLDGKLVRSCPLRGIPEMAGLNGGPLYVLKNSGYFGKLAKLQYFARAISPHEILSINSQGPFLSNSSKVRFLSEERNAQIKNYYKKLKVESEELNIPEVLGVL